MFQRKLKELTSDLHLYIKQMKVSIKKKTTDEEKKKEIR